MNRRVLLVDSDTAFRDTLTKQLGRYRVVVMTEPDAERAVALGQADPPDLVVIAVEEPEKAGFKSFQKVRKALSSKVPIVLVTASVAPESFAKHRGLKVHANEYIDKRGLGVDELVGKIDNLIGLGDLQEDDDDLGIAVEEDLPMEIADGDVVLDEQLDDDQVSSFEHDMQTVGPGSGIQMDQMLDAETDAAFASLLGDEPVPAALEPAPLAEPEPDVEAPVEQMDETHDSIPEPIGGSGAYPAVIEDEPAALAPPEPPAPSGLDEDSAIPEPVPHTIPDDEPEPVDDAAPKRALLDMESVPSPIHDSGSVAQDDVLEEVAAPITDDRNVSLAGIQLDDDDLLAIDDDVPVEVEEDVAPIEVEEPDGRPQDSPTLAAAVDPRVLAEPEPTVMREPIINEPARRPASPTGAPRPHSPTGSQSPSGAHPPVDLGLDDVAQRAESEQSGLYDRKSLRKIGELERQIAQLKTELERARAAADAAAKGGSRENQFLNLREQNLAKEKELKQLKGSLEQQA